MGFLEEKCTFRKFNEDILNNCSPFTCGDDDSSKDLNEFFMKDALNYSKQLLGKSYCFTLDEDPSVIVCAFTVSNDSINVRILPNSRKKKINNQIPREKQSSRYPAVLIGRLGVSKQFQGKSEGYPQKIADELMDFIKAWFIHKDNKTGCRCIVVDAYNEERPIKYYKNNGFEFIFSTESQEKEYTGISKDEKIKTRLMRYDLIVLSPEKIKI